MKRHLSFHVFLLVAVLMGFVVGSEFGEFAGFGVNYHLPDNGDFKGFGPDLIKIASGFKYVRFDLKWSLIEQTCGTYNFTEFDQVVNQLVAAGVRPYAILDYSNPCYSKESKVSRRKVVMGPSFRHGNDMSCSSEKCSQGYGNFAKAAAEHYATLLGAKKNMMVFTSVNEPDNGSLGDDSAAADAKLTILAARAVKAAGFKAFVGGVTEGVDLPYSQQLFSNGILKDITAMSTHPYTHHPPEHRIQDLQQLRSAMSSNGGANVKLYLDEWGYPYGGYPSSSVQAASFLPRTWLVCLAFDLNCDLGIFFDWNAVDGNSQMMNAAKTFQNVIGNTDYVTGFDSLVMGGNGASNFAARFESPKSCGAFAVWSMNSNDNVRFNSGKNSCCWNTVIWDGSKTGRVCSDGNGNIEVQTFVGPTYLHP